MCSGPNLQLWPPAVTALSLQLCLHWIISEVALKNIEEGPLGGWLRNNLLQSIEKVWGL